jgi:hypothetical protein
MLLKFFLRKIIYSILGCVFSVFIFANCFSTWEGDDATIIINFGGVSGNRAAFESPEQDIDLIYKVILTGGPLKMEPVIVPKDEDKIKISVVPGRWDILVEALSGDGLLFASSEKKSIVIKAGQNRVVIDMIKTSQEPEEGVVKIEIIFNEKDGSIYLLKNDVEVPITDEIRISPSGKYFPDNFTITVNWTGDSEQISYNWYIFGFSIAEGEKITIKAEDYNLGTYQLMVMILKDDKYYSAEITFTVLEGDA